MKRSSRLIILVGVILAVAAFAGILWWGRNGTTSSTGGAGAAATVASTTQVVQAAANIPLGAVVTASQVAVKAVPVTSAPPDAFSDPSQVVGRIARQPIISGDTITTADFASGNTAQGDQIVEALKPGFRAMAVEVDQGTRRRDADPARRPGGHGARASPSRSICRSRPPDPSAVSRRWPFPPSQ